ncbi:MAG: HtrA2 peptidase [Chloroflexi bacterium]|nr:HtrA2 peptidase [Chloroflexota bacterium]
MFENRYPNQPDGQETPGPENKSNNPIIPPATPDQSATSNNLTGQYRRVESGTSQYPYWQEIYPDQAPNRTQVNPYQSPADGGYTANSGVTNPYQRTTTNPYRSAVTSTSPYQTPAADGGFGPDYRNQPFNNQPAPASQPAAKKRKSSLGLIAAINGIFLIAILALLVVFLLNGRPNTTANPTSAPVARANPTATAATANTNPATTNSNAGVSNVAPASQPVAPGSQLSVRQVSEKVKPAVVQISNLQNASQIGSRNGRQGTNGTVEAGVGSGIIYDKAGYILTNYHVITGADSLLVTLPDGRAFPATLVGSDQMTDLAVIKVDPKEDTIPVAVLGDSSSLYVGDGVVAIGNALSLPGGPTVTAGVISALDRSVAEPGTATAAGPTLYGLIQTDAAINPGNSGGPLVDLQGQVIGINTLGAGQAEPGVQAQGIGFAISINQAKDIAQQLVANGKVSHAYMGISYQPLTPAIATQLGVTIKNGAVLTTVQPGNPAAQAGLKTGDIITSVDGKPLTGESALGQILNGHKPGDKITVQVISPQSNGGNGQPRNVEITLTERPANR